jgi:phage tail tube protein FII
MSVLLTWDQTSFQGVNTTFTWNGAPNDPLQPNYTWDDVQLIIRAAGDDYNQWENKDKNKLVKLILKVHGNTITESKQKEIKQYKIKVSDIKLAIKKIPNIEIMTENIKF